ncbi:MAG: energy transducer TonB [Bacteroidales bacterium]|nr:energy transducer TonB [Bacteroidales bacterium]
MKNYYTLRFAVFLGLIICIQTPGLNAQNTDTTNGSESQLDSNSRKIYNVVDELPGFPGGESERFHYLAENINYPEFAREHGIQGTVFVTFVVEKDGRITNPEILRGIGGGCDEDVIRIVKQMPKWKPGKVDGKPVKVQFNMPVRFSLPATDEDETEEGKSWFGRFIDRIF